MVREGVEESQLGGIGGSAASGDRKRRDSVLGGKDDSTNSPAGKKTKVEGR